MFVFSCLESLSLEELLRISYQRTFKIDHLKYKVTTRPNPTNQEWGNTEFVYLNLVFSVSQDDDMYECFLAKTKDYQETLIILDTERFEREAEGLFDYLMEHGSSEGRPHDSENWVKGFKHQNSIIQYLPKFDKFWFHEYFSWCGLTQGAINDLRLLQSGYNPTRTTDTCFLRQILEALEFHWD